jgi:hypothetical protein
MGAGVHQKIHADLLQGIPAEMESFQPEIP